MKIRIKLDCVVEMPSIPLLDGPGILDFVQRAIEPFKATEILPGTSLSFNRANPNRPAKQGSVLAATYRELPGKKTRKKKP